MNERRQKIYDNNVEVMRLIGPVYNWSDDTKTRMLIREHNCIKIDFYPHTGKWKHSNKRGTQFILSGDAGDFIKWYNRNKEIKK